MVGVVGRERWCGGVVGVVVVSYFPVLSQFFFFMWLEFEMSFRTVVLCWGGGWCDVV